MTVTDVTEMKGNLDIHFGRQYLTPIFSSFAHLLSIECDLKH